MQLIQFFIYCIGFLSLTLVPSGVYASQSHSENKFYQTFFYCNESGTIWKTDQTGHVLVQKSFKGKSEETNQWENTSGMPHSRSRHFSMVLDNGDLMIMGGYSQDPDADPGTNPNYHPTESLVYQHATKTWSEGPPINTGRNVGHAALELSNGKAIIIGGSNLENRLTDAEVFDPQTQSFHLTSEMPHYRGGHDAIELNDGRILVVGGTDGFGDFFNTSEIYDPVSDEWKTTNSTLSKPRSIGRLVKLKDGTVLYIGGSNDLITQNNVDIFDPETETWSPAAPMVKERQQFALAPLPNGRIMVIGGLSIQNQERYDCTEIFLPEKNKWIQGPDLNQTRFDGELIILPGGNLLIAAGQNNQSTEYLDVSKMEWYSLPDMQQMRFWHTLNLLPDGDIIAVGGSYGWDVVHETAEVFPLLYGSPRINPKLLSFGELLPGESAEAKLTLTNEQHRWTVINEMVFSNENFSTSPLGFPATITSEEHMEVTVTFAGWNEPGVFEEVLTVKTAKNNQEVETTKITLTGKILDPTSSSKPDTDHGILKLFPNPARNSVNIVSEIELRKIRITDLKGRVKYKRNIQGQFRHMVSTSGLNSGLYIVQVYTSAGLITRKLKVAS